MITKEPNLVTLDFFEQYIFDMDKIRIKIKAPENTMVKRNFYVGHAPDWWTVSYWSRVMVTYFLGDLKYIILDGNNETPHGNTTLGTIRNTYIS